MNKTYRKKLTNDIGIVFNVTLTKEKNAKYITFYDSRFIKGFTKLGQPITKYYMKTIIQDRYGSCSKLGLDLYGGVDNWYVDAKSMTKLINWINKTKHKLN